MRRTERSFSKSQFSSAYCRDQIRSSLRTFLPIHYYDMYFSVQERQAEGVAQFCHAEKIVLFKLDWCFIIITTFQWKKKKVVLSGTIVTSDCKSYAIMVAPNTIFLVVESKDYTDNCSCNFHCQIKGKDIVLRELCTFCIYLVCT